MAIALTIEHGPHAGLPRAEILRRIRAMIGLLQLEKSEVSFVLTNDERIHELNKVYRGKDRPTDVLAFAMHEGEYGALAGDVLGDVIVSVPTAEKQAVSRKAKVLDEVTMLLAHGLLHLLGWDHETAAKDRRMRAETARLCQAAEAATAPAAPASKAKGSKSVKKTAAPAKGSKSVKKTAKPAAPAPRTAKAKAEAAPAKGTKRSAKTSSVPSPAKPTKAAKAPAKAAKAPAKARSKVGAKAALTPKKTARKAPAASRKS